MVVPRVVLPVKQPEFKVFGIDVGDRMTAAAQRNTRVALRHPAETEKEFF